MSKNNNLSKTHQVYEDPEIIAGFWERTKDFAMKKQLNDFISLIGSRGKILDLGCGAGRDSRILAEKGYEIVGIDYSNEMLKSARKLHGDLKNIHFRKMDMRKLDFKNRVFDGVWASASLLHIPKKEIPKVLREVRRVLKPNGYFFVAVKKGEGERMVASEKYGKPMERFFSFFEVEELRSFLERANFEVVNKQMETIGDTKWIQIIAKKRGGRK